MQAWRERPCDWCGYHHGNLKEALIEAACRFIAERGIGGFTLVDATRLIGVTPAALYRHSRGREALLEEAASRGFDNLAARLVRVLGTRGSPLERFTRMGEAYLAFAEEEPGYHAAIFDKLGLRPIAGRDRPHPFKLLVEALRATFPDGFDGVDPHFVALEVWALSHVIATLSASGQLPASGPEKYELLRAGVLVHGAGSA